MKNLYCTAELNYVSGEDAKAVSVPIYDGRTSLAELDFDECGFTLLNHVSKVSDWYDTEEVQAVHCPEMEQVALDFTGCTHAISYTPLVRSPRTAAAESDYGPILSVHSDFTEDYRPMVQTENRPYRQFIEPLLEKKGLTQKDIQNASRVMMFQCWRNIGEPTPDFPFAVCDAQSVPREQLGTYLLEVYAKERLDLETFYANEPGDKWENIWYTFPKLSADEVIVFRAFDSEYVEKEKAFWTMHTSFKDPSAGSSAPARESVEMRVLCLW